MRSPVHHARRAGFSLVETVLAAGLLGLLAAGATRILAGSADQAQHRVQQERAHSIARSTVERIRAAGPRALDSTAAGWNVTPEGARSANGMYAVRLQRQVLCAGGAISEDTPAALLGWGCTRREPVVTARVFVTPPDHRSVQYAISWGPADLAISRDPVLVPWVDTPPQVVALAPVAPPAAPVPSPPPATPPPATPAFTPPSPVTPIMIWDWGGTPSPVPVISPPQVSVSPSAASVQVGQAVTWSATYAAGSSPLILRDLVAAGQSSSSGTLAVTYSLPGTYYADAQTVDQAGRTASARAQVSVLPSPLVAHIAGSQILPYLRRGTWTGTAEGGVGPYTYQWASSGVRYGMPVLGLDQVSGATASGIADGGQADWGPASVVAEVLLTVTDAMWQQVTVRYAVQVGTCGMRRSGLPVAC